MIKAVIFDLDGTLTKPFLDFAVIRRRLGLSPSGPVLEQILALPEEQRASKFAMLEEFESEAVENSELNEGVREIMGFLASRGISAAVCTRNSRRSAGLILQKHGLAFGWMKTRDDGPVKPSPAQIIALAGEMGVMVEEILVVGDFAFDTESGLAAGAFAVFLTNGNPPRARTRYHYRIAVLPMLAGIIEGIDAGSIVPSGCLVRVEEAGRDGAEG